MNLDKCKVTLYLIYFNTFVKDHAIAKDGYDQHWIYKVLNFYKKHILILYLEEKQKLKKNKKMVA